MTQQPFETIEVDTPVVACDGGARGRANDPDGHPRVFLNLAAHGSVECPYCSRLYVLRGGAGAAPAH